MYNKLKTNVKWIAIRYSKCISMLVHSLYFCVVTSDSRLMRLIKRKWNFFGHEKSSSLLVSDS